MSKSLVFLDVAVVVTYNAGAHGTWIALLPATLPYHEIYDRDQIDITTQPKPQP